MSDHCSCKRKIAGKQICRMKSALKEPPAGARYELSSRTFSPPSTDESPEYKHHDQGQIDHVMKTNDFIAIHELQYQPGHTMTNSSIRASEDPQVALAGLTHTREVQHATLKPSRSSPCSVQLCNKIPSISESRKQTSLVDNTPFDIPQILHELDDDNTATKSHKTVLYLAYGSNLSAETFLVKRGIKPLSQVNVVVPDLSLTFDLPGVPYREPCFANTRYRTCDEKSGTYTTTTSSTTVSTDINHNTTILPDYHKLRWKKGMVGVVYEVTHEDYVHIIATEGGGAGYKDIVIDCYTLDADPTQEVPLHPRGTALKAHTLYEPYGAQTRPDTSYAQPSPRYMKLLTDGAAEHDLPLEYRRYLADIRSYHITTKRQTTGAMLYFMLWGPIYAFFFIGAGRLFLRKDGTYPPWFARLMATVFRMAWTTYDRFFKPMFGDGERSLTDQVVDLVEPEVERSGRSEKTPLLWDCSNTVRNARSIS